MQGHLPSSLLTKGVINIIGGDDFPLTIPCPDDGAKIETNADSIRSMNIVCGDNRFEIIKAYKEKLIECTNIEDSPEEMSVIDDILFRFWQMGWLKEEVTT